MGFGDSYLGQLRRQVGSDLVLMPGAMVAVMGTDGQVLMTRRSDDGTWCLPAGAAEPGGSFAKTAIDELREETGLVVDEGDLVAFGSLSDARLHTITYPNGDITHCFALCFLATVWSGEPRADDLETTEVRFADPMHPPAPVHGPADEALKLLKAYLNSKSFQLR